MDDPLTKALIEQGRALGFTGTGVSDAKPARRLDAYIDWLANDFHGEMGYMARPDRVARRRDLNEVLPGVRSIISVSVDYQPPRLPEELIRDPSRGRISNYAWGIDYHKLIEDRLNELSQWLRDREGGSFANKVYVDTGAILERDHAESAGLGFTGKNTMLIDPRGGSFLFLGQIFTTAELESTKGSDLSFPSCGTCRRCLDSCPTNAFPTPHVLDARRCISYLTIEYKGWIPEELRPLMGNWIYGCDICQEVCPFSRFSKTSSETAFFPENWDSASPHLLDILSLDVARFEKRFANSPIKRIGRDRLVRNACVAAGNWGSGEAIPALTALLQGAEPIVRGHAAWALGKIGGPASSRELTVALKEELNKNVRKEIASAFAMLEAKPVQDEANG